MTTKTFLTSAVAMGFIAPVMAAPTNTGTFPSGGLMQADYTYTNAATSTNMDGVYEGTVNAEAQYENILYTIGAGKYLPAGSETVIDCNQSGYFCPGLQSQVQYDENNAQGLTSCSTATNGAYTLSDGTGSTADSCYRQCSGNVTIQHATGVTGYDYYGNGVDTCEPTACENGYHLEAATGNPDWTSLVAGNGGYTSNMSTGAEYDTAGADNSIIVGEPMAFVADFSGKESSMIIKGRGRCSTQSSNNPSMITYETLTDETGTGVYCWCHLDGYSIDYGKTFNQLSGPWVANIAWVDDGATSCANHCAYECVHRLSTDSTIRNMMFGAYPSGSASCEANTITINWTGTSTTEINANNAGTATYGSDIRTPRSATPVPGKRFTGWRFSKPTQTNLP